MGLREIPRGPDMFDGVPPPSAPHEGKRIRSLGERYLRREWDDMRSRESNIKWVASRTELKKLFKSELAFAEQELKGLQERAAREPWAEKKAEFKRLIAAYEDFLRLYQSRDVS